MEKKKPAGTILIVDDEQSLLRLLERILRREEFETVTQNSGAGAITWLDEHAADLMLLDLNLPDMSGKQVVSTLAKKNRSIPFIVITGLGDVRVAVEIMKMGAVDYLVKDADFLEMVPVVVHWAMSQLETKRKLAAAEEQVRLVQSVVEQGFNAVLITTAELPEPRIVYVNPAFTAMTGYSAEAIVGREAGVLQEFAEPLLRMRQDASAEPGFLDREVMHRKGGSEQWIEWRIGPVHDPAGKITHWVAIMSDITLRKQFQKQILDISELEQRRIGQDLHDGLCQHLAGIQFMSQVLEQKLVGKSMEVASAAAEIARLVRQSISHTRDLVKGLSPVLHHEEGLIPALRELAEQTQKAYNVSCAFTNGSSVRIPDQTVATHLYRIAQEAVNNSITHGKAKRIAINLISVKDRTILSLRDDGIGFPRNVRNPQGVGLQIMKYRASMIGGTLTIQPEAGGGTTVVCSIQKSESANLNRRKLDYEKEISSPKT